MKRVLVATLAVLTLSACGSTDQPDRTTPGTGPSSEPTEVEPTEVDGVVVKKTYVSRVRIDETEIELKDGRVLTCLINTNGGMHCLDPKPQ